MHGEVAGVEQNTHTQIHTNRDTHPVNYEACNLNFWITDSRNYFVIVVFADEVWTIGSELFKLHKRE